jgi:sec-independent protein translocase protein TatA
MYQGTILEFLNMGGGEIALIMIAILLLFGGKKLPELARGLGKGIREFKDASEGVKREIHRNINAVNLTDDEEAETVNHSQRYHPVSSEEPQQDAAPADDAGAGNEGEPLPAKGKESHIE